MVLRDLPSAEMRAKYRFMYRISEFANNIYCDGLNKHKTNWLDAVI
jgi:hypothetical protein